MWDTNRDRVLGWTWRTQGEPPEQYLLFMEYAVEQCTTAVHEEGACHGRRRAAPGLYRHGVGWEITAVAQPWEAAISPGGV